MSDFESKLLSSYLNGENYEAACAKLNTTKAMIDDAIEQVIRKMQELIDKPEADSIQEDQDSPDNQADWGGNGEFLGRSAESMTFWRSKPKPPKPGLKFGRKGFKDDSERTSILEQGKVSEEERSGRTFRKVVLPGATGLPAPSPKSGSRARRRYGQFGSIT